MIADHLEKLRTELAQATGLPETTKNELLKLVETVEAEVAKGGSSEEGAEASPKGNFDSLSLPLEKLEASHPQLAEAVNRLAVTLANMGI